MEANHEGAKLDDKKVDTVLEIIEDEKFQDIKYDKIKDTKIFELSKETQDKLNEQKITKSSPEYKEFLIALYDKITKAKTEDKKITTV
jgi:hypothetical protein